MPDLLRHAAELLAHGLLTELPAQLVTAAVVTGTAGAVRAWRKRRAGRPEQPAVRDDGDRAPAGGPGDGPA
ncbi:hypothetical protein KBP30_38215 [Streptomyces sp. Go40/10]|uniref:hypothetical protein n=1 Tax=Streptomyces sp. Go40/10 TaxID=2825844 RepID=UPI001E390DB9|nr:hypothetical protein [Streptomyces sp. Go40/10]UFR06656.1 hypothetical protein KBP30_38215 [Streptomyces sp. Go40/10]